jgi:hypothetical protein
MRSLLTLLLCFLIHPAAAQEGIRVEGVVLEKGTRTPLEGVNVFLLPHHLKEVTDPSGRFTFPSVPEGAFRFVVNLAGYRRFDSEESVVAGKGKIRKIFLERLRYEGQFETTIVGRREKRDESTRVLTQEQFLGAPGAGGDPIKALQNLPGVNRSPGFTSFVVVQGSELQATSYLIDGHEVPLIFHFGALSTVVFPEAIDSVDYLSAGYGPEYGRALGGLVSVRTRNPRRDRLRGLAFVDVVNAGGLLEGRLSENSGFLLSFRQSYIGEVLSAVVGDREDFNFTVAPRFSDLTAVYHWTPSPETEFRLTGVGSLDTLEFLLKNPVNDDPFLRGAFRNRTRFFRLIPQLSLRHAGEVESRYSLGLGWTEFRIETDENLFDLRVVSLTPKAEIRIPLHPVWTVYLGTDNRIQLSDVDVILPNDYEAGGVFNPLGAGEEIALETSQPSFDLAVYLRNTIRPIGSRWTFSPSGRIEYFRATGETYADPRMAVSFDVNEGFRLKVSGGRYHQGPEERESSDDVGNPDLVTPSAWHLAAGFEKDFRAGSTRGWTLSAGPFFRWFEDLVIRSNRLIEKEGVARPEYFNNSGSGTAIGGEGTVRYEADPWGITLAYTLLQSRRSEPGIGSYPAEFDQTHSLNFLAGVNLPRNWRLSTRLRYVTGNPYTPVVDASYDADHGVYIPLRGPYFSRRLSPFFQWDLRIDKKWVFDNWLLTLYLDLQNATNRRNSEGIQYGYDYGTFTTMSGLPFIPTFGLKGEF